MSDYTPITGELRKYAGFDRGACYINEDSFNACCDEIDSVHAQLERENAALKAELDRMLGEQEEYAHMSGESITGELREYAEDWDWLDTGAERAQDRIEAIADRIDAEHERAVMSAMNDALYHANDESMAELGWVRLPKDADGEVWHVGDFAVGEVNPRNPKAIERMVWYGPDSGWQIETNTIIYPCPDRPRHHHATTVEDVLREFALKVAGEECMTMRTGVVEEFAKRLQLAGDAS